MRHTTFLCRKTLIKRTYAGPAFVRGRRYRVVLVDDLGVWLHDEERHTFGPLVVRPQHGLYWLRQYFVAPRRFRRLVDAQHVSRG